MRFIKMEITSVICSNTLNTMMKVMLREDVSFQSLICCIKIFGKTVEKKIVYEKMSKRTSNSNQK